MYSQALRETKRQCSNEDDARYFDFYGDHTGNMLAYSSTTPKAGSCSAVVICDRSRDNPGYLAVHSLLKKWREVYLGLMLSRRAVSLNSNVPWCQYTIRFIGCKSRANQFSLLNPPISRPPAALCSLLHGIFFPDRTDVTTFRKPAYTARSATLKEIMLCKASLFSSSRVLVRLGRRFSERQEQLSR